MDSLDQRAPERAEIPRFDDGMVNIQELIRIMAESLVNEIMDAQAEDACADGNRRNGYRERALVTSVGTINLRIPKLRRGSYFPEDLLTRYSRVDRAVVAAVSEMVTCGVSTRKVERVAASLGIDRMSASQVSRICESLDDVVADLQERDLSGTSFPYIWVDATYVKCRDGGHVSSCALVTAIGAGADGYRRLLGLDAIDTESYAGWLAFLSSNPLRYQQSAESVDHSLIGEQVDVKLTSSSVTVMHGGAAVAVHPRLHGRKGQYSTNVEHMPENHAALDDPWSPVSATVKSAERATRSRRRRPRIFARGATAFSPAPLPGGAAEGALRRRVVEVRAPDLDLQRRRALGVAGRDRPARHLPPAQLREPHRNRDLLPVERGEPLRGVRGPHDCPLSGSPSPSAASASRFFMR